MKKNLLISISLAALFLTGCSTYKSESAAFRTPWSAGDTAKAEANSIKLAEEYKDDEAALIFKLEEGTVTRGNANVKKSVEALEAAHKKITAFEKQASVKIGEEIMAFATNPNAVDYKGYNYDKIMMSVYLGMGYMELKDFDNARVQFKRLENYQKNAVKANQARIDREEKAIKANKNSKNSNAVVNFMAKTPQFQKFYGSDVFTAKAGQQAKSLYVNPFAYWISGVYFLNKAEDTADKERAQDMFRIGNELLGGKSKVFAEDFQRCENVLSGKPVENITYVVYETGCAPLRNQFKLDLPLFLINKSLPHVSMNFPYLERQDSYKADLDINAGGKKYNTETIVDMDSIIRREFNDELPRVVTKMVVSAATKATVQYVAAQAAGDYGIFVNIAFSIFQVSTNYADLRTWTTLPKQIKVARVVTPADGVITIDGQQIKVSQQPVNIVLAKRMFANGKLSLRSFDFSDAPAKPAATVATK